MSTTAPATIQTVNTAQLNVPQDGLVVPGATTGLLGFGAQLR